MIWRRRWITDAGVVECRDALAFPGDPHRAVLMRRVTAEHEPVRIHVRLAPAGDFDRHGMRALKLTDGDWCARAGDLFLRWHGAPDAVSLGRGRGRHHESAGAIRRGTYLESAVRLLSPWR